MSTFCDETQREAEGLCVRRQSEKNAGCHCDGRGGKNDRHIQSDVFAGSLEDAWMISA